MLANLLSSISLPIVLQSVVERSISTIGSFVKGISIAGRSISTIGNCGRSLSIGWKGISISVAEGSISTIGRSEGCCAVILRWSSAHTHIPEQCLC